MTRATRYIGYSRNRRLVQNPRTDPLRSSEAGMMYPLTRKNTKTPYSPRSSQRYRKSRTGSSMSVDPWSNTTQSAANPRSASSHASLLCFGAASFAPTVVAAISDISPDVTAPDALRTARRTEPRRPHMVADTEREGRRRRQARHDACEPVLDRLRASRNRDRDRDRDRD